MMPARPDCELEHLSSPDIDVLFDAGIDHSAIVSPFRVSLARGDVAQDDRFEPDLTGERWFAFEETEPEDIVFWHHPTGRLTTWCGRAFALGQTRVGEAATYSFDNCLNIFGS